MTTELIGDIIDKLTIINIKIWDATQKANIAYKAGRQKQAHDLFTKVETMNIQRKDYIDAINLFFTNNSNLSNQKSFTNKVKP